MTDPDENSSSTHPSGADDFRTLHLEGDKKTTDLPPKASSRTIKHNFYFGVIRDHHLDEWREGGGTSLSEISQLPPRRFHPDDPERNLLRYPTVRRLLNLAHETKERPESGPRPANVTVSKKERELLFEWRPLLEHHDGFRALAQYLLHHTFRTEEEGRILASRRIMRRIFGLDPDSRQGNLPQDARALELLWLYALFVDPRIRWSDHHSSGRARTIKKHGTPEEIREEALRYNLDPEGRASVGLFSGSEINSYRRKKALDALLDRAHNHEPTVEIPDATGQVVSYHNELVQSRAGKQMFTNLSKRADRAVDLLRNGKDDEDTNEGVRASIRRVRAFEKLPRPVYRASDYTPRPVSVGRNHPMQLPGEVLKTMFTPQYVYLDGSKIQLALFEKLARDVEVSCPKVRDYLQRHLDGEFDLWSEIGSAIDLPDDNARRQAAKRATYAALYFSGEGNLYRTLTKEYAKATNMARWPEGDDVKGFFEHPVVEDLLSARNEMKEVLAKVGRMEDAFGIERAVEDFSGRSNPERTLLSCVLQGHELKLMQSLYEEAHKERELERDDRFRIALYKYDGIVVWIREGTKEREREKWIGHLQNAFEKGAEDVLTRLDVEQVGPPET